MIIVILLNFEKCLLCGEVLVILYFGDVINCMVNG